MENYKKSIDKTKNALYNDNENKRFAKKIKLSISDIEMIEKKLNQGLRIEIYPVKADDIAIAALNREKIK